MQTNLQHADEDDLEKYSLGTLSEGATEILEEHLLLCPTCRDNLTEMDAYLRTMKASLRKTRVLRLWDRLGFHNGLFDFQQMPGLAWAAGAVFCLALLLWVPWLRKAPGGAGFQPVAVTLQTMRGV